MSFSLSNLLRPLGFQELQGPVCAPLKCRSRREATCSYGLDYRSKEHSSYTFSDYLAVCALEEKGHRVVPVDWREHNKKHPRHSDDLNLDDLKRQNLDALIVRSPHSDDFVARTGQLLNWLEQAESAGVPVLNSPDFCRWNSDKHYLSALVKEEAAVVPFKYFDKGAAVDISQVLRDNDWKSAVIKPAISIGGFGTYLVHADGSGEALNAEEFDKNFKPDGDYGHAPSVLQYQKKFDAQLRDLDMIVSEYRPEIKRGEWSFIFFNGRYSHAVRKMAKGEGEGNLFVNLHHGGGCAT